MLQVTVIPGDGIGPEIVAAAMEAVDATGLRIRWEECSAGASAMRSQGTALPSSTLTSLKRTRVGLKGPLSQGPNGGVDSTLRRELELYANVRPARSLPGVPNRYEDVDLVVIRENTQGLYSGIEHSIDRNTTESIAVITREGSQRILRYAFEYAKANRRRRITLVHKSNVLKLTSALFLEVGREVARSYPRVVLDDLVVDGCCHQLVRDPSRFDMIVTTSLFGDIIGDLCSGLVGGYGVAPCANIGAKAALFEAVHGTASSVARQGVANPGGLMLAAGLMLRHLGQRAAAERLQSAVRIALRQKRTRTPDVGGSGTTRRFTNCVIRELRKG